MISAVCIIEVDVATAFCSIEAGTIFGSSAAMVGRSKATTAPSTVTAARMPAGVSHCCQVAIASTSAVTASINWQTSPMRRRSNRSATWPTTKVSTAIGRNWQKPTRPSAKALCV